MVGEEESKGVSNRTEEKILVSVRLRPLNDKELITNDGCDWECLGDDTIAIKTTPPNAYTFDRVFGFDCQTKQVYEEGAKDVILSVLSGINSTVFAYGQTSSGKTYTMNGITEYAVGDVYNYIKMHKGREFVLRFSAMEIYNEAVRDLLCTDSSSLRLLDDPQKGTVVEKLTEQTLKDQNHLLELLSVCAAQRKMGETSLNETSSRSHQILRLTVESSSREFKGLRSSSILTATVNFVDLAGSERSSQTLSTGARLKEGSHINRSLLTLGTVIRKLSKGKNGHVPYRDSKLTRILQSSLGGNARTAIVCTLSPARSQVEQSRNALLFATCAKEVTTNAKVNVVVSDKALVKQLKSELAKMEHELKGLTTKPVSYDSSDLLKQKELLIEQMSREIKELRKQRDIAESRIESMIRLGSELNSGFSIIELSQTSEFGSDETMIDQSREAFSVQSNSEKKQDGPEMEIGESNPVAKEHSYEALKQKIQDMQKTINCLVDLYPQEESPCSSELAAMSSTRSSKITRSRSCRAVLTTMPSVWLKDYEDACFARSEMESPGSVQSFSWKITHSNHDTNNGNLSRKDSCSSTMSTSFEMDINRESGLEAETFGLDSPAQSRAKSKGVSVRKLLSNDSRASILSSQTNKMKDIDIGDTTEDFFGAEKGLRQKLFKEKFGANTEKSSRNHFLSVMPGKNGFRESDSDDNQSVLSYNTKQNQMIGRDRERGSESDGNSSWQFEFETRRQEIIELWDSCCVPLVHRTYFFLLFKGEPSDSVYYEVELRRLSFLRETFSLGGSANKVIRPATPISSSKILNREREMLSKQVHRKFTRKDRESLYQKWGIALNTKQRSLQLVRQLWSNTRDLEHLRESAVLVAKLVGFVEESQVPKVTFGLSFTPQNTSKRPFVWKHTMSSLS